MIQKYEKLISLLKELFQLNQPDLDFGLYRVMHAKSEEITGFLEKDLMGQVKAAFDQYQSAVNAEAERGLKEALEEARRHTAQPEDSELVKAARAKLKATVDVSDLENDVYDHLFSFFRRYYSQGDFHAKRVYKDGVYAIPYEGEEVTLHWASKDQYYIKTSEYLQNYTFRLRPDSEENPLRVHFQLTDATEGEHGNVKAAEGKNRMFVLAATEESGHDFLEEVEGEQGKELIIRFEYRPSTLDDWPDDERGEKKNPPDQKNLISLAVERILATDDPALSEWISALGATHTKANGDLADYSRLEAHLKRYTARNTFDYFIHKDLGTFLRRELDFYIKNEIMHLDDVESDTVPRVERYLSKIKVIRKIAGKIIDFLAQLEGFQKKLWLKKKFVVETHYCITVGCIPEQFYPEIVANEDQRTEWVRLLASDKKVTHDYLQAHPTLVVDTQYFDPVFTDRLVATICDYSSLHEQIDGLFIHSENFQALNLLKARYRKQIECFYIDPPYNAKSSEILYKNTYRDSSWISLMENRITEARNLESSRAVVVVAIDEVEQEYLGCLLNAAFPDRAKSCITIVHNATGQQGNNFSSTHEYAYFLYPIDGKSIGLFERADNPDVRPLRDVSTGAHLRTDAANCFYAIIVLNGQIIGFGDVCADDFHPRGMNVVREDGAIEIYPIDQSGIERKWAFARHTVDDIKTELFPRQNPTTGMWDIIREKTRFNYKTVWTNKRYSANSWGSRILNELLGEHGFSYPKSIHTVRDCIDAALKNRSIGTVLDYFAGSGTTAHAVINLNREDGGRRKFILVEMGDYFETVLLPRTKKVTFAPEWKKSKPKRLATAEEAERSPRIIKVVRLESYEDTLNNLETYRTGDQQSLLESSKDQGNDDFKENYFLRYMLDVETRGSQSLLNVQAFADPTAYKLKVKKPGSDESRQVNVDLIETFNWLIGLTVRHISAPQTVRASTRRDSEGRLRMTDSLSPDNGGPHWFRVITGSMPDGRDAMIVWRKLTGNMERDNLVLDEWFVGQGYLDKGSEFDLIYVNGSNNLENLKSKKDLWKVRLIEDDFHRLMFEMEGA